MFTALIILSVLLALASFATLPTATVIARTGIVATAGTGQASTTSDKFANNGKQFLLVHNGDSGAHVLTFTSPATVDGLAVADPTVSLAAGASKLIGPFKPSVFNDEDGYVTMASDIATLQTVQVLQADTVLNQ